MFTANSYNPDSQPLGHYKGHPVYLATVLVAAHIVTMLLGVIVPSIKPELVFAPGVFGSWAQIWRWVTYPFVQDISIWFVIEMFFLYRFGIEIEKVFGRRALARLYAGLILLPALLVALLYGAFGTTYTLFGTNFSHFCLFLGICMLYPGALMFQSLPWLTLKVAASILLAVYILSDLAARDWTHLLLLLSNVALTYGILRHAGLTPRFEKIQDAIREALPAKRQPVTPSPRRARPSSDGTAKPSKYYEPKIKPKPDLAPERKAVEEIDALLDKIARHGIDSLTAEEKAALQRASSKLKDSSD
jgi:membrane associated rhomboid family serine protease